ncbi:MAG: PSD1 and planctomycete cytochrome C domain-containing protein [Planctomycetota bacterium]
MHRHFRSRASFWTWLLGAPLIGQLAAVAMPQQPARPMPDFERDVRPILQRRCLSCHGLQRQRKNLRLDFRDGWLEGGRSGPACVPGDSAASLALQHVTGRGGKKRMPPRGAPLAAGDVAVLRAWIDGGLPWSEAAPLPKRRVHWAYAPPADPALPAVRDRAWPRGDLDRFVLARLERRDLTPSPESDPAVLLRRVSLDLTGLPPTLEDLDAFCADPSPAAYERAVDRLLASPHFGERWAQLWLDLARYADTKGYEKDGRRTMWPYRDWLIRAINRDLPFDQFTMQQLAGDLLPDADDETRLATAFHRNTMTNDEGGTDNEEFRVEAVADRVDTTAQVWMGTTMGCARCHDHKYDPFSQREYYQLFAFFNQTEDADREDEEPRLAVPSAAQRAQRERLDALIRRQEGLLEGPLPELDAARDAWVSDAEARLAELVAATPELGAWQVAGPLVVGDDDLVEAAPERVWVEQPDWVDGQVHPLPAPAKTTTELRRTLTVARDVAVQLSLGSDDGLEVWVDGERRFAHTNSHAAVLGQYRVEVTLRRGAHEILLRVTNQAGPGGFAFALEAIDAPVAVRDVLRAPAATRTGAQRARLTRWHRNRAPELAPLREAVAALRAERGKIDVPKVPVLRERPAEQRRPTHVLNRGSFLSPGAAVEPGVPAILPPLLPSPASSPIDRLALARWLVSPEHPLTARVVVNRYWEQLFGRGLVARGEDFGTQGEPPSHPQLLDWLARRFIDDGWSRKALLRRIVTSATYRQSSAARPLAAARDPDNELLWRGPRHRLAAETVRDQALAVSGLLVRDCFGPPVMPPQPDGLWQVVYNAEQWQDSGGPGRYRRALYTFWRRTNPYPSLVAFDAPSREVCAVRRVPTNTPLQALVTLNDPAFVEAAQALARRICAEAGSTLAERAAHGLRLCVARTPTAAEIDRLVGLYASEREHFERAPEAAWSMATDPLGPLPGGADAAELAAWTVVANVLLNLDEVLTKG